MSRADALHAMCGFTADRRAGLAVRVEGALPARTDLSDPRGFLIATGGVERRNPLPPGRYWVDVFQSKSAAFNAWLARNKTAVKVESTESFPGDLDNAYESRDWVLFRVLSPAPWEGPGLPTVADASVKTSDDTVQKPPPEKGPLENLPKLPSAAGMGAVAAAAGLGLFALVMYLRK